MRPNRYLPNQLSQKAAVRLFCLPYAGGSSAIFHRWQRFISPHIEVVPVELPGRGARIGERPHTDLRTLVAEIADALAPSADRRFALLGHSLGAWVAFELARELRRRHEPMPCLLIAAASPAPGRLRSASPMHSLPDREFVDEIERRFGGIPPAVRENDELLRLLLPSLRADIELLETYQYVDEPPLAVDIFAIGGTEDRAVSAIDLAGWRQHTETRFSSRLVPGGHFFLFPSAIDRESDAPTAAVRMIVEQLGRYLDV